ncbi:hypothetical protein S83_055691, partial [Arachis hypogaea]
DVMVDGKSAWTPSSGMLPRSIEADGDGYRPYFEKGHADIEEYFGDSEEVEQGLKCTRQMGVQEMVAMFLNTVGHGVSNRMIQERFQHSGETISRHFHEVLVAYLRLSIKYIKPSDPRFQNVHSKIKNDQRYWPFFKNAIGAID